MKNQPAVFPPIEKCTLSSHVASYDQKCQFHERILFAYLKKVINGWSVRDFLYTEKIDKYILYAITDFTEIFCDDLKNVVGIVSGMICDKRVSDYPEGYKGWNVICIEDMMTQYRMGKINKIIVLSVIHENEIMEDLLQRGIALNDLISIVSIVYS